MNHIEENIIYHAKNLYTYWNSITDTETYIEIIR